MELLRTIAMLCPLWTPHPGLKDCGNSFLMARINQEICVDQFNRCVDAKLNGRTYDYRIQEQARALKQCIKEKNIGRKENG